MEPLNYTKEMLERIPSKTKRIRLKPALSGKVREEFVTWVRHMGYETQCESMVMRQFMFESFCGGWGARNKSDRDSSNEK